MVATLIKKQDEGYTRFQIKIGDDPIVDCKRVNDDQAVWLSRDIAKKVEAELTYPGQIKVTVIRETRSIEYAK